MEILLVLLGAIALVSVMIATFPEPPPKAAQHLGEHQPEPNRPYFTEEELQGWKELMHRAERHAESGG